MQRLIEWIKAVFQEKVNIFIKGFFGGSIISGIFLFGGTVHAVAFPVFEYFIKIIAVGISGVISGCATVFGNDLAQWIKSKMKKNKPDA